MRTTNFETGGEAGPAHTVFAKNRVFTASDGTPIVYAALTGGDRVPIVYVNGWSCPDAYWAGILPGLVDRGHPALVPDVRGAGHSGLPRAPGFAARNLRPEDVSVARLGRDVVETLEHAGVERAVLVGHSMGVQILFEAYRAAPEKVAALVPTAGAFENPVKSFADLPLLDRLYPFADAIFRLLPFESLQPFLAVVASPAVAWRFARWAGIGGPKLDAEHLAPHMAHLRAVNLSVLWRIMTEMRLHTAADLLPKIDVPVLILAGRRDYMAPPSVQQRMHELIPASEIVWFEEGTHLLPVDEAEAIVERIYDFLARRVH